jgi:dihydroorotase
MTLSRRDFLASGTLAAGATLANSPAAAGPVMLAQATPAPRGFDPADATLKYDLVIANADVLDPSQGLRGKRDVGIKNGQIAALSSTPIPAERSTQRYDAGGRLTTPGLIDLHTHYGRSSAPSAYPQTSWYRLPQQRPVCRPAMPVPTTSARSSTG